MGEFDFEGQRSQLIRYMPIDPSLLWVPITMNWMNLQIRHDRTYKKPPTRVPTFFRLVLKTSHSPTFNFSFYRNLNLTFTFHFSTSTWFKLNLHSSLLHLPSHWGLLFLYHFPQTTGMIREMVMKITIYGEYYPSQCQWSVMDVNDITLRSQHMQSMYPCASAKSQIQCIDL